MRLVGAGAVAILRPRWLIDSRTTVKVESPIQDEGWKEAAAADRHSPQLRRRMFKPRAGRKWLAPAAAAACTAALGFCFLTLPFLQGPVNYSYDLPFYFRSHTVVQDVVVLYMDEHSEAVLQQGRWEKWDRTVLRD